MVCPTGTHPDPPGKVKTCNIYTGLGVSRLRRSKSTRDRLYSIARLTAPGSISIGSRSPSRRSTRSEEMQHPADHALEATGRLHRRWNKSVDRKLRPLSPVVGQPLSPAPRVREVLHATCERWHRRQTRRELTPVGFPRDRRRSPRARSFRAEAESLTFRGASRAVRHA